jgi:hypothetical protein
MFYIKVSFFLSVFHNTSFKMACRKAYNLQPLLLRPVAFLCSYLNMQHIKLASFNLAFKYRTRAEVRDR